MVNQKLLLDTREGNLSNQYASSLTFLYFHRRSNLFSRNETNKLWIVDVEVQVFLKKKGSLFERFRVYKGKKGTETG